MPDVTSINPQGSAQYRDPAGGTPSSVGPQIRTDFYQKKALIEAAKEMYFGQLADVTSMPKNMGKKIKRYHYIPLLDDANVNDQGIDAAGIIADGTLGTYKVTIAIRLAGISATGMVQDPADLKTGMGTSGKFTNVYHAIGEDTVAATALAAAQADAVRYFTQVGVFNTDYATTVADILAAGGDVNESEAVPNTGNLYGSSKDVGYISGKLPTLSETGGRVNRVGFRRVELEGSIEKLGFFDEYTQESLDFDTDEELLMHINREMVMGANEINEDMLQIDLLNSAGVVRFGGTATQVSEINGEAGTESLITYDDLMRMSIDLDENRCPKHTKLISGSRMIDTRTIDHCRYLMIGTELQPQIKKMVDPFGNQAFISVEQYAAAGQVARGEIGTIDQFRIIVVPEMMHWAAAGAVATGANAGYRTALTGGTEHYNVYPMLCVGSGSFTSIGFQTDGKQVKFTITHKKPGKDIANRDDPYGEVGFMSIKWYYGFMLLRPERIALAYTVAEW